MGGAYTATLPAPSSGAGSVQYVILAKGDGAPFKSQVYDIRVNDSDKVAMHSQKLDVYSELEVAPRDIVGFTDNLAIDVAESGAKYAVVAGIMDSSGTSAVGAAGSSSTTTTATTASTTASTTATTAAATGAGIGMGTVAIGVVAAGAAVAAASSSSDDEGGDDHSFDSGGSSGGGIASCASFGLEVFDTTTDIRSGFYFEGGVMVFATFDGTSTIACDAQTVVDTGQSCTDINDQLLASCEEVAAQTGFSCATLSSKPSYFTCG